MNKSDSPKLITDLTLEEALHALKGKVLFPEKVEMAKKHIAEYGVPNFDAYKQKKKAS